MRRRTGTGMVVLVAMLVLVTASAAQSPWTRITALPADAVYGLHVKGDTVLAGTDTSVWVSTNAGASWRRSAPFGPTLWSTDALWLHAGRIWAGTTGGGVFTSDDLGLSWQPRSDGLAGGLFGSDQYLLSFAVRRDTLYAGTGGAGVFARPLTSAGPWQPTGGELVAFQAGSVEQLASDGRGLIAVGGFNGLVFRNTGGAPWAEFSLNNSGVVPDLGPTSVVWNGRAYLVGTNHGVYASYDGQDPWIFTGLNLSGITDIRMATNGALTLAWLNGSGGGRLRYTTGEGEGWNAIETVPAFALELAFAGSRLWAARTDGLWYRDAATLSVPAAELPPGRFALRGDHPVRGSHARFSVPAPGSGQALLEVFDVAGRRRHSQTHRLSGAGAELAVDVSALPSGVYLARMSGPGRSDVVRFVRLRG